MLSFNLPFLQNKPVKNKGDYILYHARDTEVDPPGEGDVCSPRAQKIEWKDGYPVLGVPLPVTEKLPKPSGTK